MAAMSVKAPLARVHNCFAFNYLEYDPSIPSIVEGRIHPIQFANSVTRINVAARTHRDKNLFLLVMFSLGLLVIAVYPFLDTNYYLFILLVFLPLCLIQFFLFNFLKHKTLNLLSAAVEQENDIFVTNGMRLIWEAKEKQIVVEVVRRVSLSYENSVVIQSLQEQERERNLIYSRSIMPPEKQEKMPLLQQMPEEIEVSDVLSHNQFPNHPHSRINNNHVQIPVE